jgi:hypothetical protein
MPANSGVCTERTRFESFASPGSVDDCSFANAWPLHLIPTFEHMFERASSGAGYEAIASAFAVAARVFAASFGSSLSCVP